MLARKHRKEMSVPFKTMSGKTSNAAILDIFLKMAFLFTNLLCINWAFNDVDVFLLVGRHFLLLRRRYFSWNTIPPTKSS